MSIQEILATAVATAFAGIISYIIGMVKEYLLKKGGESAVRIVEIIAKNAVQAVEQINTQTDVHLVGSEKLTIAKAKIREELSKYNIYFTDEQLDTFIESAVHDMNRAWKGN